MKLVAIFFAVIMAILSVHKNNDAFGICSMIFWAAAFVCEHLDNKFRK